MIFINEIILFFQTFYRENIDSSKILRPQTTNAIGQNLFMPNFTTHDVIEEVDSQKSSVISHWDQLSGGHQELLINEEDPDEVFSEMRPAAASSEATTSEANVPKGIKISETVEPCLASSRYIIALPFSKNAEKPF